MMKKIVFILVFATAPALSMGNAQDLVTRYARIILPYVGRAAVLALGSAALDATFYAATHKNPKQTPASALTMGAKKATNSWLKHLTIGTVGALHSIRVPRNDMIALQYVAAPLAISGAVAISYGIYKKSEYYKSVVKRGQCDKTIAANVEQAWRVGYGAFNGVTFSFAMAAYAFVNLRPRN